MRGVIKRQRGNRRRGAWLCGLGIHRWGPWGVRLGDFRTVERKCRRCKHWQTALWARPKSQATTTRGGQRRAHTRDVSRSDSGPAARNHRRRPPTVIGRVLWMSLLLAALTAAAPPVESLVAVVPEGFWSFTFHTEEGDVSWRVFVTRDTVITEDDLAVAWAGSTTAVISFVIEPALVCTSYTFVDPPWPPDEEGGRP